LADGDIERVGLSPIHNPAEQERRKRKEVWSIAAQRCREIVRVRRRSSFSLVEFDSESSLGFVRGSWGKMGMGRGGDSRVVVGLGVVCTVTGSEGESAGEWRAVIGTRPYSGSFVEKGRGVAPG
jgi:hypothetical protein